MGVVEVSCSQFDPEVFTLRFIWPYFPSFDNRDAKLRPLCKAVIFFLLESDSNLFLVESNLSDSSAN